MRKSRRHSGGGSGTWPDDAELQPAMRTAQQGEPGAVDALLAQLLPLFTRFFAREVDRDTADDLTQEALLGVMRALPRLDPGRASRYVTRVAQLRLRSAARRRARDAQRFAPIEAALDIPSSVRADYASEFLDLVRAAAQLPPRVQACVLATLCGLSPADIAAVHGVSPTTVRRQLQWARAHLRATLSGSTTERHTPGLNAPPPREVRETARLPRLNERFPELRRRGSRGRDVAAQTGSGRRRARAPRPWKRRARTTSG